MTDLSTNEIQQNAQWEKKTKIQKTDIEQDRDGSRLSRPRVPILSRSRYIPKYGGGWDRLWESEVQSLPKNQKFSHPRKFLVKNFSKVFFHQPQTY